MEKLKELAAIGFGYALALSMLAFVFWVLGVRFYFLWRACSQGTSECSLAVLIFLGIVDAAIDAHGNCLGVGCHW